MFLYLSHTKLEIYKKAGELLLVCYEIVSFFPSDERFNLTSQIKRAALSVKLNIAEGSSRRSLAERRRFYEIARGSLVEVDAALDVAIELGYVSLQSAEAVGKLLISCYRMLSTMIGKANSKEHST